MKSFAQTQRFHTPGNLCACEPQWGNDGFGMYQNLVEGREVPWSPLLKDMAQRKHRDLDFILDQLDWDKKWTRRGMRRRGAQPCARLSRRSVVMQGRHDSR